MKGFIKSAILLAALVAAADFVVLSAPSGQVSVFSRRPAADARPFLECWSYPTDKLTKFNIASDNASKLLLPLQSGVIESLDARTGDLFWRTELGGEIVSGLLVHGERLFVVIKTKLTGPRTNFLSVLSISLQTGIVDWRHRLDEAAAENAFLGFAGRRLGVFSDAGAIFTLNGESGERLRAVNLKTKIISRPVVFEDGDFATLTDRKELVLANLNGGSPLVLNLERRDTSLLLSYRGGYLLGDETGNIKFLDPKTGKILWKTRTGARVRNVLESPKGLVVSSNDNYIYLLSKENGERIW